MHAVRCTVVAAGAFSPEVRAQEMFLGGDTIVRAGNSLEALELSADNLHFADGQSAAFLSGDSAQCVIGERITRSERDCTRAIRFRLRFTRCGSP